MNHSPCEWLVIGGVIAVASGGLWIVYLAIFGRAAPFPTWQAAPPIKPADVCGVAATGEGQSTGETAP